jgi:antitoxin component of MazEF toxin-antitoxin module
MPTGSGQDAAKVTDKRRIIAFGNSHCVTVPPAILDLLELEKGDEVEIVREDGQSGFSVRAKTNDRTSREDGGQADDR